MQFDCRFSTIQLLASISIFFYVELVMIHMSKSKEDNINALRDIKSKDTIYFAVNE